MKQKAVRRGPPVIRAVLLLTGLLASLTLVVWRQSTALEMLRGLDAVRQERIVEEARRASLSRRVEELESRARVSVAARERLGMRVPSGAELVILPMAEPTVATFAAVPTRVTGGGEG
ncbi:MAG: hypothetical protein KY466_16510 [Gemmatimonadetes bacterium]|nr:hypothetical protein [Gemmatimonadota bacterium]